MSPSTTLFLAWSVPAAASAIASTGTARTTEERPRPMGAPAGGGPNFASWMTAVSAPIGSSGPKRMKSSQLSTTATVSSPPGLSTGPVETRSRQQASPPRIWEPKLLVSMAR